MTTQHTFSLQIAGEWEDAWLYRGMLIVWDSEGAILTAPVDDVSGYLMVTYGRHVAVLAEHFVLRSERKSRMEFRELFEIEPVWRAFMAPFSQEDSLSFEIPREILRPVQAERVPGNICDVAVYGNRLYAATEEGLFETRLPGDKGGHTTEPLLQIHDASATSVVATYGRVSASFGEDGLRTRQIDFGEGSEWVRTAEAADLVILAEYSRAVSSSSSHLLSYGDSTTPEFIRASTVKSERQNGFSEIIVGDFEEAFSVEPRLTEALHVARGGEVTSSDSDVEVLGNADYRLLVRIGTSLQPFSMRAFKGKQFTMKPDKAVHLESAIHRSLHHSISTHSLGSGFLVETRGGVHLIDDSGSFQLSSEMVIQARTFPRSRRYRDTIALIREDRLELIGFAPVRLGG